MTYAVGDLHGEVSLLQRLLEQLPISERDTLIFLGDYLDRGDDSAATIEELMRLRCKHTRTVFLRGNHEQAWLSQWDGRGFRGPPDIQGAEKGWADFGWDPPAEFGYWLARTWIEHEDEHAYYVHAGLLPGKPVWETPDLIKLTGAPGFMESPHDWGKPVVFGHHELPEPLLLPNKIGVDTGAWRTGVLTAVRLPDRAMFQTHR